MGRKVLQLAYFTFLFMRYSLGSNRVEMPYGDPCSWLQGLFSRILR